MRSMSISVLSARINEPIAHGGSMVKRSISELIRSVAVFVPYSLYSEAPQDNDTLAENDEGVNEWGCVD